MALSQRHIAPQRLLLRSIELFQHLADLARAEIVGLLECTPDMYGGLRTPETDRVSSAIVALDARTGA